MNTWVCIDMNYHGFVSQYAHGMLRHGDQPTAVIYGILRLLNSLADKFDTNNFVFAFDSKDNLRKDKYPWYKRRSVAPDSVIIRQVIRQQLQLFRKEILPELGYTNICIEPGFEADDIIAVTCHALKQYEPTDRVVIASGDEDLYQLIRHQVMTYRRFKNNDVFMTAEKFREDYFGLSPKKWIKIKAIAGCKSDTIPGVSGVGIITAAKYIAERPVPEKLKQQIDVFRTTDRYRENLELVTLPYLSQLKAMTHMPKLQRPPSRQAMTSVLKKYGIRSLTENAEVQQTRKAISR